MLDVHPPHHPASTWRDFFIHIATIVIGLLIAIGLEQTVEYVHHRRQVAETLRALREERRHNIEIFAKETKIFRGETARFQTNLAVLLYIQAHPGAPRASWPGVINWHNFNAGSSDSAWLTAQQDNVTALMPQDQVRAYQILYKQLAIVEGTARERLAAIRRARRYMVQDSDPSHLSPAQLAEQIVLTQDVLIFQYRLGSDMRNLNQLHPDFAPSPKTEELIDIVHEPHTIEYLEPGKVLGVQMPEDMKDNPSALR